MSKILDNLGIYGIPTEVENFILVGLQLGDPILLIGPPGTAKTNSVEMIGQAIKQSLKKEGTEFDYQVYDSSKLNFEDLIGFLNPKKLSDGSMDFIKTPTTIWNKQLVSFDEFNRIDPDRQSNLFEIIRSRKCMGLDTGTKFIINCMNPYGDTGTEVLSEALVDRHLAFVEFPEFHTMDSEVQNKIIDQIGNFDCRGYKYWTNESFEFDFTDEGEFNEKLVKSGSYIRQLIEISIDTKKKIEPDLGPKITNLIKKVINEVNNYIQATSKENAILISGRRAGLIKRGILAYRSIEIAKSLMSGTDIKPFINTLLDIMVLCIPIGVSGSMEIETSIKVKEKIKESIRLYWPLIEEKNSSTESVDLLYELFNTRDLYRKFDIIVNNKFSSSIIANEVWNNLISSAAKRPGENKGTINILNLLASLNTVNIPDNIKANIINHFGNVDIEYSISEIKLVGNATKYSEDFKKISENNQDIIINTYICLAVEDFSYLKNPSDRECISFIDSLTNNISFLKEAIDKSQKVQI